MKKFLLLLIATTSCASLMGMQMNNQNQIIPSSMIHAQNTIPQTSNLTILAKTTALKKCIPDTLQCPRRPAVCTFDGCCDLCVTCSVVPILTIFAVASDAVLCPFVPYFKACNYACNEDFPVEFCCFTYEMINFCKQ